MFEEDLVAKNGSNGLGNQNWTRDIAFLVTGLGLGSAIALMLAPRTGEELRHTIHRGYRRTTKNLGRHTEDLRDRAEDLLEHAHDLRHIGSRLLHF
jgi:gas vesicle protein